MVECLRLKAQMEVGGYLDHGLAVKMLVKNFCAPQVIRCIENGLPLLIENLPEDIEAVLDPVISKRTFRRGNATLIRLGDAEVQVHAKFRCRS